MIVIWCFDDCSIDVSINLKIACKKHHIRVSCEEGVRPEGFSVFYEYYKKFYTMSYSRDM